MKPIEKVLDAARSLGIKKTSNGWTCRCPAHDDTNPSLSITEKSDGRVLVHCFTGCAPDAVVAALGLKMKDLMPPSGTGQLSGSIRKEVKPIMSTPTPSKFFSSAEEARNSVQGGQGRRADNVYWYTDGLGERVGGILRWDLPAAPFKKILPIAKLADGWACAGMPKPWLLYNLPDVILADEVWVVEGEKCVEAAKSVGLCATTSVHGCQAPESTDWSPLAGKRVVICPDNDEAGEGYVRDVLGLLGALSPKPSVRVVRLPGLAGSEDIADYVAALRKRDIDEPAIRQKLSDLYAASATADAIQAPVDIKPARIEWTPIPLSQMGPSEPPTWILPGFIARGSSTLFTGLWKAGKTTFFAHLLKDLQQGEGLVDRALGLPILVVSEESARLWKSRRDELGLDDSVHIISRPFKQRADVQGWHQFVSWVSTLVSYKGYGLVVIDTVSSVWPVTNENDASEVMSALMPLIAITEANAGLVLVHHPKKGDGGEATASRGSGAMPGYVDVILELRRHDKGNPTDRRRTLTAYSRFDETPPEVVIELGDEGYTMLGAPVESNQADRLDAIQGVLASSGERMTADEVLAKYPGTQPGKRCIQTDLNSGATEGRWERWGKGRKGDPFRYGLNPTFDSRTPSPSGARNESDPTGEPLASESGEGGAQ